MEIDFSQIGAPARYKLLVGLVFPRPIALVYTSGETGVANCAPFSFFNAVCEDPPLLMVSYAPLADGSLKHSLINSLNSGSFAVNLVDEGIASAMHVSSGDFPAEVSEFAETGLTPAPCHLIPHPRVAEAPVCFECRVFRVVEFAPNRQIIFGKVVYMHVRDGIVDPRNYRVVDTDYRPVGRIFGKRYCTSRQRFEMPGAVPDFPG